MVFVGGANRQLVHTLFNIISSRGPKVDTGILHE